MPDIDSILSLYIVPLGWKLISAVAVWVIGGWAISFAIRLLIKNLNNRKVDATLVRYVENLARVGLRILLVVSILGILGIETTSIAALLAATGVAIGAAWGGLLSNFAAGVFLVFLRPFQVGDAVTVGGVSGTVKEIGIFGSTIITADNVQVVVGNNAIFSDKIQNYSANPYRRVDLTVQLAHNVDPLDAIQRLRLKVAAIPNVLKSPEPEIEIFQFNQYGTLLVVHPCTHNDNYPQVYFDTNRAILEVVTEAKYSVPEQRVAVRNIE